MNFLSFNDSNCFVLLVTFKFLLINLAYNGILFYENNYSDKNDYNNDNVG